MVNIVTTQYYDEYLRYFEMAKKQQASCNLGITPYLESNLNDDLMHNVELYDVVERKYAGFSALVNDIYYGWDSKHPYYHKMIDGHCTPQRQMIAKEWTGKNNEFGMPEWLYLFILHRVCGSGINYAVKPSGYHNTIIPAMSDCRSIEDMAKLVNLYHKPFYTSVGYQFPAFPKPPSNYKRGGDYYLTEYAPRLARDLANYLWLGPPKDLREVGAFMLSWNVKNGMRQFKFQYAAVVADIADWMPQLVNRESHFYYGTNAVECISYLIEPKKGNKEVQLDSMMDRILADTGALPYNAEDVCCDFIRWVENYIRPGRDYDHLDFDNIWSSCTIKDHPFGRQKAMIDLGLVKTFKGITKHPSDDAILKLNNLTVVKYKELCIHE